LIKLGNSGEEYYDIENDDCSGYRCVSNNMVTGACYDLERCLEICRGTCEDIQKAKRRC
jgi:hypothetical protein